MAAISKNQHRSASQTGTDRVALRVMPASGKPLGVQEARREKRATASADPAKRTPHAFLHTLTNSLIMALRHTKPFTRALRLKLRDERGSKKERPCRPLMIGGPHTVELCHLGTSNYGSRRGVLIYWNSGDLHQQRRYTDRTADTKYYSLQ